MAIAYICYHSHLSFAVILCTSQLQKKHVMSDYTLGLKWYTCLFVQFVRLPCRVIEWLPYTSYLPFIPRRLPETNCWKYRMLFETIKQIPTVGVNAVVFGRARQVCSAKKRGCWSLQQLHESVSQIGFCFSAAQFTLSPPLRFSHLVNSSSYVKQQLVHNGAAFCHHVNTALTLTRCHLTEWRLSEVLAPLLQYTASWHHTLTCTWLPRLVDSKKVQQLLLVS